MDIQTRIVKITPHKTEMEIIKIIAVILQREGIIAYPTDTFYGLGANCFSKNAIQRIYQLKGRKPSKPLSIVISDIEMMREIAFDIPHVFWQIADKFWPGPLTIVLKASAKFPPGLSGAGASVGIRLPDFSWLRRLVRETGIPITATSANISGRPTPLYTDDVELEFDRVLPGSSKSGIPSTVLDITSKKCVLLRKGMVSIIELEESTGKEIVPGEGVTIHILYVCSGNMCRSPMAEAHLKSLIEDLDNVRVHSAGTIAVSGMPLSIGAGLILDEENIDIQHQSVHVAKPTLNWADIIFVMEEEHKNHLIELSPESKGKIVFLGNFKDKDKSREIEDPIGKGIEVYREVFTEIETANKRVEAYLRRKFE